MRYANGCAPFNCSQTIYQKVSLGVRLASKQVTTFMRSVLIGSEYPVTDTPHFLFPEKFILQTHICVKYQKNPFYFVTYSNSYKIAKKWLQNCRGGVVNSKDAGLRPLCERNATMKRGRGQTLGYFSPCGKEERKISDISRRTLVIGANLRQAAGRGRNTGPVRMTV